MSEIRALSVIAADIRASWTKVSPYAEPYLSAMEQLTNITDSYGCDDADGIVRYFLSNASGWRGDVARRIKDELKSMLTY